MLLSWPSFPCTFGASTRHVCFRELARGCQTDARACRVRDAAHWPRVGARPHSVLVRPEPVRLHYKSF